MADIATTTFHMCVFSGLESELAFLLGPALTSSTANAALSDNTVPSAHGRPTQAGGGRGSRREAAKVSGKEPSSCHAVQTEKEGLGDVTGKESRGTHPDKHAASGVYCTASQSHCL